MMTGYWAVAQTVSKMEHIVRRDIEKGGHGAFLPTLARHWKIDGIEYAKEIPVMGGYVFFMTDARDWAGIPDIHGVYRVLSNPNGSAKRVSEAEMARIVLGHASGAHNRTDPPRFTKYYRPDRVRVSKRKNRKPRPGNRLRNFPHP